MPNLNINGRNMSVEAAPDTPLLWAIREQLQMTGTKFGCGAGLCGACTVHVNGEAVRYCQTSISDAAAAPSLATSSDAGNPSVTPNVNPAAPTMKRRRPLSTCATLSIAIRVMV